MSFSEFKSKNRIATFIDLENINKIEVIPIIFNLLDERGFYSNPKTLITSKISQEEKTTNLVKDCCADLVVSFKKINKGKTKRIKDSNKNNADFRIYIEALKCLYKENVDAFCIASSDEHYTELILTLKNERKYLIGIGNKDVTSEKYVNLFDEFYFVEDLMKSHEQKPSEQKVLENKKEVSKNVPTTLKENPSSDLETSNEKENKKTKEEQKQDLIKEFCELAKAKISLLKPGKYNLSNITSEIKSEHPKHFSIRINVELYQQMNYNVHIDNEDKSNAYILVE